MPNTDISCPHCGQAHPAGVRFCPVSGKPITGIQACRYCGGKIREGWNVCPHCGRPLEKQLSLKGWIWTSVAIFGLVLIVAGGYQILGNQASKSSVSQDTSRNPTAEPTYATVIPAGVRSVSGTITPRAAALLTPTLVPNTEEISSSQTVTTSLTTTNTPTSEVIHLSSLEIELWPEYDQPTMLVIYRLKLSPEVPLPTGLTFRIPARAGEPSAVAERRADATLFSLDYEQQVSGEWSILAFQVSLPEIQVEYYDPALERAGISRQFEFLWPGEFAIESLKFRVQQPWDTRELHFIPEEDWQQSIGQHALVYHSIDLGSLKSSQTFSLSLNYQKPSDTLSAERLVAGAASGSLQGKIVFTCQIFKDPNRNQICLINADGSGWMRLSSDDNADHTYPSFSPDGQAIVFALEKDDDHQIYEMDLGGNQRQLTDLPFGAYAPAISPDNRWIVFTGNDGRKQTIWLMNCDGSEPRSLSQMSGDSFDPTWFPDGGQILFASNQAGGIQLFAMNIDGSDLHQVTQMGDLRGRSDWSPDGEAIATYTGSSWHREIVMLGKDGKQLAQITDGGNNLAPNYSPDGQWIAFTSYRDNYGDDNGCEIYIMWVDASQVSRLTENNYCDWQPNWGP